MGNKTREATLNQEHDSETPFLSNEDIAALAALPPLEYEQTRQTYANKHNIRVSILDAEVVKQRAAKAMPTDPSFDCQDVALWDQPVNGSDLLNTLVTTIERFCILPGYAATLIASWVVHAWTHDAADISPVLAFVSPEKRCGKSTALTVVHALAPKAELATNLSAAVMFRLIEKYKPTLLIDEADTFLEAREEMRGMINGGHNRQLAYVWRCEGDDHEPKRFNVWAPKVIAMIGNLPDTLEDRALVIPLKRKEGHETVERMAAKRFDELLPIRRMAARWACDNTDALYGSEPAVPEELNDRAQDNARFLCAIADLAGGDWPERVRADLVKLALARKGDEQKSPGVLLLTDIGEILERWKGNRINSQDLVNELVAIEDGPWEVWRNGQPITTHAIATLLKSYDVEPSSDGQKRGYAIAALRDAVERYAS